MEIFREDCMKKLIKTEWHIIFIVLGLCLYSALCWGKFCVSKIKSSDLNIEIDTILSDWESDTYKMGKFCRVDTLFTYLTTGELASKQVAEGENGWLFYKSQVDGDPIGDYEGTNYYNDSELKDILCNAIMTQEKIEGKGIQFEILIAPNKENIYSEYMPDTYVHAEESRTDILVKYLQANGVNVSYSKNEMLAQHLKTQLYYSYDTHWNQLGAYIGVRNVLENWEIEIPKLENRTISSSKLKGQYHACAEDDLANMLGLRDIIYNDEIEYVVDDTQKINWETYAEEQGNNSVSHFENKNAIKSATIFLVGDSFRTSMLPSLGEVFSDVYVIHRSAYTENLLDEIQPDYLIVEYVERYSNEIGKMEIIH